MKNKEQRLGGIIYSYLILTNIDQMITTHVSPGHDKSTYFLDILEFRLLAGGAAYRAL